MNSKLHSPYAILFYFLKSSGYLFFSMSSTKQSFQFHRTFLDYVLMVASLIFSGGAILYTGSQKATVVLRSFVLNNGLVLLWDLLLLSTALTRVINIFAGRRCFLIFKNFQRLDNQVTLKFRKNSKIYQSDCLAARKT